MSLFTNRRKMLLGLVTATTAAATGATASGGEAPQEDANLIALSDQLEPALQTYLDARATVASIAAQWGPQWPTPDPEIYRFGEGCKGHRDILGHGIKTAWGPGIEQMHRIGTPAYFEGSVEKHRREYERKAATKSGRGAKFYKAWMEKDAACIEPSRAYWAEVERITEASGIKAAKGHEVAAREALQSLVGQIVTFEERTVTGLIIKAQAMQAWDHVGNFHRGFNLDALAWSEAMTATIIRQATGGASA